MKERHEAEKDALNAEMDAELAAMEKNINESIETEHLNSLKEIHRETIQEVWTKRNFVAVLSVWRVES